MSLEITREGAGKGGEYVLDDKGIFAQANRVLRGSRGALTLPCIQSQVMMVSTRGEKSGRESIAHDEIKAYNFLVELDGCFKVCDIQVDVTQRCARRDIDERQPC